MVDYFLIPLDRIKSYIFTGGFCIFCLTELHENIRNIAIMNIHDFLKTAIPHLRYN